MSKMIECFIFFMMAFGWGTVYKDVSISTFDKRSFIPMALVYIPHMIIAILIYYDTAYETTSWHMFSGIAG
jgi:hypothetical protein